MKNDEKRGQKLKNFEKFRGARKSKGRKIAGCAKNRGAKKKRENLRGAKIYGKKLII